MFDVMIDDSTLRPASRADVLFAISLGLNTRHGHQLAAHVAAEVILAAIERQGFVLMRRPPARDSAADDGGRG